MRIIDKNNDFYDYLQNVYRDGSITFDRTDSFVLTKEDMCRRLTYVDSNYQKNISVGDANFVLLQVCNTFWLFLTEVTEVSSNNHIHNYSPILVSTWKDYSKPRTLIQLNIIKFSIEVRRTLYVNRKNWREKLKYDKAKVQKRQDTLVRAIATNDYEVESKINRCSVSLAGDNWVDKHIPLLKASGFASCIDPLDIYLSFEEYFSLGKTASERIESVGLTDREKIENHGFDTKVSFRGK